MPGIRNIFSIIMIRSHSLFDCILLTEKKASQSPRSLQPVVERCLQSTLNSFLGGSELYSIENGNDFISYERPYSTRFSPLYTHTHSILLILITTFLFCIPGKLVCPIVVICVWEMFCSHFVCCCCLHPLQK